MSLGRSDQAATEGERATAEQEPSGDGKKEQQTGRMPGPAEVASAGAATRIPEDIPDGQDDDIVAQQLREAAMAEADPELREKLWDEYRRYKAGLSE